MTWQRIRYRLLLINLLIVAVPLGGIGFARFYERESLRSLEADLVHQARLIRLSLLGDPKGLQLEQRGPLLKAITAETVARIRILDPSGKVIADAAHADVDPEKLIGDLREREEVQRALGGHYGATTRATTDDKLLFLCVALPIDVDGKVAGVIYVTRSTLPVHGAMLRLRAQLLQVLLFALVFTFVLTLFLAATISRPLSRLTRIAERIAGGDRRPQFVAEIGKRGDEIGQLARSFDVMAQKLDERARYIAEMAADISHEFKSPLTSIRGAAELLQEGAADDLEARARFLQNILNDAQRLDRLVSRLLELSRVESERVEAEPIDLIGIVNEIASRHADLVVVETALLTAPMRGRRAHLTSAVANLVENALQHAAPNSKVRVTITRELDELRVAVNNQGTPIPAAQLPKIWDRFFTTRAAVGGSGLGLAIVQSAISAHGGVVNVTSDDATGTTFRIALPTS